MVTWLYQIRTRLILLVIGLVVALGWPLWHTNLEEYQLRQLVLDHKELMAAEFQVDMILPGGLDLEVSPRRELITDFAYQVVILILTLIWVTFRLIRPITGQIEKITAVTREISAGNLAARVGPIENLIEKGELGVLANNLDQMADTLQEQVAQLQQAKAEVIKAYDATIEGWSQALDLRDRETEGHSLRVTEMTLRLADTIGFEGNELMYIRWGALLHDIGKLGIPDAILHKPGPLDDAEWAVMRRHPAYAYNLLRHIDFLQTALEIPYCHHEHWDGSGYPRGLQGEEIPLSARIFALADVWDALRYDRPYRKAWPDDKVLAYIQSLAGNQLDPSVVGMFMNVMGFDG